MFEGKVNFDIKEVAEIVGVQPHVLRYWEVEFPLLAPQKNKQGERVYTGKDVEIVLRIRELLYEGKHTIASARLELTNEMDKRE